jgi:hypothetical protein
VRGAVRARSPPRPAQTPPLGPAQPRQGRQGRQSQGARGLLLRRLLALTARARQLEHDPNAPLPESLVKAIALSKRKEAEQVAQDILSAIFQTVTGGPLVFPAKPTPVRRA